MFETQYNEQMEAEIRRLEAEQAAAAASLAQLKPSGAHADHPATGSDSQVICRVQGDAPLRAADSQS